MKNKTEIKDKTADKKSEDRRFSGRVLGGTIIILVGLGLLLRNIFNWFSFNYVWPLLIIAVGVYLLMRRPR